MAEDISTDWVMLWDTDEIREALPPFTNLREAFYNIGVAGYNTINFDEFVFMPTSRERSFLDRDYVAEMKHYYYFAPLPHNRMTCWKKGKAPSDLISSAGHQVRFRKQKIFPDNFILRHYLFFGYEHGVSKYSKTTYSEEEPAKGWNLERSRSTSENFCLPEIAFMQEYRDDNVWNRSDPKSRHPCFPYEDKD